MVSYYNPLGSMLPASTPGHHTAPRHPHHPQISTSPNTNGTPAYFNPYANYSGQTFGTTNPTTPGYNLASDLNSNMYGGTTGSGFPGFEQPWHAQSGGWAFAAGNRYPGWADAQSDSMLVPKGEYSPGGGTPPDDGGGEIAPTSASPSGYNQTENSHSSGSPTPPYKFPSPSSSNFNPPGSSSSSESPGQITIGVDNSAVEETETGAVSLPASSLSPPGRPQPARSPYEWMKKPSYTNSSDKNGRTRTKDKYRVVYSDHQRLELEKEFHYSRYITIRRKAELANNVGLSERQVKIWFQNRRAKERRAIKKTDDTGVPNNSASKDKIEGIGSMTSAFSDSIQNLQHQAALMHGSAAMSHHHHHHQSMSFGAPPPPPTLSPFSQQQSLQQPGIKYE